MRAHKAAQDGTKFTNGTIPASLLLCGHMDADLAHMAP